MIDIKKLREQKEYYLESFSNKGTFLKNEIEEVLVLYEEYLLLAKQEQHLREELNKITKHIKNNKNDSEMIKKAKNISSKATTTKTNVEKINKKINKILAYFPNPSSSVVPVGKNEKDNIVISTHINKNKENPFSKPHWEIIESKNLILSKESSFISGTRHIIYNGSTALVVKALERFMLDNALNDGFQIIEPPIIVNRESLFNTGQLPKFEDDLFKVGDQFLIPTAEVPLTNLVANKLLSEEILPLRYVAGTNCFRKEAGSAGKDTRGLIRLHQFRKVELVTVGRIEDEEKDFDLMLKTATLVLEKLELPYRLVQICTGDLSFTSQKTIDIEVWMPGVKTYREVSSVSSIGDFQARRMKTKYKDSENNKYFVNTYNGSSIAIGRTLAAIIENNIQQSGLIRVPRALQPYLPFIEF